MSGRAEAFPSSCLVGMDVGLEMVMRQPGEMGTQDREEGAEPGRRAAACARMPVRCGKAGSLGGWG